VLLRGAAGRGWTPNPAARHTQVMESAIGWLIIGFLAGSVSGWVVGVRSAQGCLPTIVVGIIGAVVGGWLAEQLNLGQTRGFIGALVLATLGSIAVRIVLRAIETRR
jgi:uncharacterized membrane protein YeaQ/YmgE (transglycosylase-associated protein family)